MTSNYNHFLWDHSQMYHLQLDLLVQLDLQYRELNIPHIRKKLILVSPTMLGYEEHQDTKEEKLTVQSKDIQKTGMSKKIVITSTTLPMGIISSI